MTQLPHLELLASIPLCLALSLTGCSEENDVVDCADITDADACSEAPGCHAYTGTKYGMSGWTLAACQAVEKGLGCTTAVTPAVDPDGERWDLSHGCIPEGWTRAPSAVLCETITDSDTCTISIGCVSYVGRRADSDDWDLAACQSDEFLTCEDAITPAYDAEGVLWELSSTCLPEGWIAAD